MLQFNHSKTEDGREVLTVLTSGDPIVVDATHPNFQEIVDGVWEDALSEQEVTDLADLAGAVGRRLTYLTPRVSENHGRIFFDAEEVDNSLTRQMVRLLEEGDDIGWSRLALFMENIAANPSPTSRAQLYDWLDGRDFTITDDGCLLGYKGVKRDSADAEGVYRSLHAGGAYVDGGWCEGFVPNSAGAVVEMPRGDVKEDSGVGCSTGLHVGTHDYARSYSAHGAMLRVIVNPRDVVSVPTDCNAEKLRCCRYEVAEVIDHEISEPVAEPTVETRQAKASVTAF